MTKYIHVAKVPNDFFGLSGFAIAIAFVVFSVGCQDEQQSSQPVAPVVAIDSAEIIASEPDTSPTQTGGTTEPTDTPNQESGIADKVGDLIQQAQQTGSDQTKNAGNWLQSTWQGASDSGSQMTSSSIEWANKTFQSLKDQGLTTAESTGDWLNEDWQNMESWEYKIVNSKSFAGDKLEPELNRLGKLGWECFSVNDEQMFFKKPRESYLRRLPFKDLLRLAPLLNNGN